MKSRLRKKMIDEDVMDRSWRVNRRITWGIVWGSAVWICLSASQAVAMINPYFTPIHLTMQSKTILELKVKPLKENNTMPAAVVRALKGKAPEAMEIVLLEEQVIQEVQDLFFEEGGELPALAFFKAGMEDGYLNVDGKWFLLIKNAKSGDWRLERDLVAAMDAVWEGPNDMLLRCVEYILSDENPEVPVRVGATWGSKAQLGKIDGRLCGMAAADLAGDGRIGLFVFSEKGDRVFEQGEKGAEDRTGKRALSSASRQAVLSDVSADGKLDVISWDGKAITVWVQSEGGTFEGKLCSLALTEECQGLATVDVGGKGRCGIVVSAKGAPVILAPDQDGTMKRRADMELPAEAAKLGDAGMCVIGDFTGDQVPDIAQIFKKGVFLWKGKGADAFEATKVIARINRGSSQWYVETGDFDGNGLLDLIVAGYSGFHIFLNRGGGVFTDQNKTGEPDRFASSGASGVAVGDLNNDGRQDFALLYKGGTPQAYFNRGFATFGMAGDMALSKNDFFKEATFGQEGGLLVDLNGDGGQDLALTLPDGTVWVVYRSVEGAPGLGVVASLPASAGVAGPVTVTGWDRKRCLGAWNVAPGSAGAFFGKREPGPVTVKWRLPGGGAQEKEVVTIEGPVRMALDSK